MTGCNPDEDAGFRELEVDLAQYDAIGWWNSPDELTWQVDSEVARFPPAGQALRSR